MSIKHGLFRYMKRHSSKYGATGFFLRQKYSYFENICTDIIFIISLVLFNMYEIIDDNTC